MILHPWIPPFPDSPKAMPDRFPASLLQIQGLHQFSRMGECGKAMRYPIKPSSVITKEKTPRNMRGKIMRRKQSTVTNPIHDNFFFETMKFSASRLLYISFSRDTNTHFSC